MPNFTKILILISEIKHADGRMDRRDLPYMRAYFAKNNEQLTLTAISNLCYKTLSTAEITSTEILCF
jgi:hypothetical protein